MLAPGFYNVSFDYDKYTQQHTIYFYEGGVFKLDDIYTYIGLSSKSLKINGSNYTFTKCVNSFDANTFRINYTNSYSIYTNI